MKKKVWFSRRGVYAQKTNCYYHVTYKWLLHRLFMSTCTMQYQNINVSIKYQPAANHNQKTKLKMNKLNKF